MTAPLLSLVIPTYNERDNIGPLVRRLSAALEHIPHELLVVDDDSPDRTWEVAEEVLKDHPAGRVIRRTDARGLSSAVVDGFHQARGEILGVIDADLQHDETILPRLVEAARECDFAVGSRHVHDGGVGEWNLGRRFQSWFAKVLARLFLDVDLADPMSGYFLVRREVFQRVAPRLQARGYKILLEMYCHAAPASVQEVGYVFRTRERGESKLGARVVFDFLRTLWSSRKAHPAPRRFLRFAAVGGLGVVVNEGVLWLLHHRADVFLPIASIVAVQCAIVHNFLLNDLWTFGDRREARSRWGRFWRFEATALLGMGVNVLVLTLLVYLAGMPPMLANLVAIACAMLSNFTLATLWAWER